MQSIIEEVTNLVKSGVKEVVLVGIEIASYGKDLNNKLNLVDVIEEIKEDMKISNVNLILGNEEKKEIVKYVEKYLKEHNINITKHEIKYVIGDISKVKKYVQKEKLNEGINIRESVKIEDGCNNFCSYCVIPYVRGNIRSRSKEDILSEVDLSDFFRNKLITAFNIE